ncbi:MAG TPA: hypothetical protein VFT70_08845 [Nocardioides sp.]|nr:hypothetical protein [Nocardioides sp.]
MRGLRRSAGTAELCHDTERLLRSGRAPDDAGDSGGPDRNVTVLLPGTARRRVEQSLQLAQRRLSEAQRLLAPHRARPATEEGQAYAAVHAAKCDLVAARYWSVLEERVGGRTAQGA